MRSLKQPRCPRGDCNGTTFEEKDLQVRGETMQTVPYLAVQCATCGAVVAITEYEDVPRLLRNLSKKLDDVERLMQRS